MNSVEELSAENRTGAGRGPRTKGGGGEANAFSAAENVRVQTSIALGLQR